MWTHAFIFLLLSIQVLPFWWRSRCVLPSTAPFRCRRHHPRGETTPDADDAATSRRKPEWVREAVLHLATHRLSCRQVTDNFNRNHGHRQTIGKTWVHEVVSSNADQIRALRRGTHNLVPPAMEPDKVWALDLTCLRTGDGQMQTILGIIDHGSRAVMRLKRLPRKCAWTLLGHLCLTVARHGRPAALRTDNESMFTSRLWRLALWWMNIRRQRTKVRQPWQNGRIERLFGSLKPLLRQLQPPSGAALQQALDEFGWFYNHVRVHLHLAGRTPMEVRLGETSALVRSRAGQGRWVSALGGLLLGYHLRR
jgi:putative transposase